MTFATSKTFKSIVLAGCATSALILSGAASAQAAEQHEFEIAPQDLGDALAEFSVQGDAEVYWLKEDVAGKKTDGVSGSYTKQEAIRELLDDAGVEYRVDGNGTLLVGEAVIQQATLREDDRQGGVFRVASLAQENDSVALVEEPESTDDAERERDTIIVTGTNIRGIAPESSPIRVFDREAILESGVATTQDFIQLLPENFGGGANPDLPFGVPGDTSSLGNRTFGASINLRGLGSGSTLTLLNGRRVAPTSINAGFVDISMIPAAALERIEILTDGASSIYGSDAIAGVANFVLRDDYEGIEGTVRYGSVTSGDFEEFRGGLTAGTSWDSGNILAVYEYFNQTDLGAEDRSFSSNATQPFDLLPSQDRHSVVVAASQDIGRDVSLDADLLYSNRSTVSNTSSDLQSQDNSTTSESINLGAGVTWDVSKDWEARFSAVYSAIQAETTLLSFGSSEPADLQLDTELLSFDLVTSGTLFTLNGNDVKIAIGGHARFEDLNNDDFVVLGRDVYAAFGELYLPIISPQNDVPGFRRLEVNASVRHSDFSDFGSTTNPKVGVLWSPVEGLRLRGSYSTSFQAPILGRVGAADSLGSLFPTSLLLSAFGVEPADPSIADVTLLSLSGTDPNLEPETSRAFTLGAEVENEWSDQRLRLSLNYYNIRFKDRVDRVPVPDGVNSILAFNLAFDNPNLFPPGIVTFNPSQDEIAEAASGLDRGLLNFFGQTLEDTAIITRANTITNVSETNSQGLDFGFEYSKETPIGRFNAAFNGTYIIEFSERASTSTPAIDEINTLFNPVDFRARGSIGLSGEHFSGNIFVNYTDDYTVDLTPDSPRVDDWLTFDLSVVYKFGSSGNSSLLNDVSLRASVLNVFDQDPPAIPDNNQFLIFGFDPTNSSPLNRFVSFEVTKAF